MKDLTIEIVDLDFCCLEIFPNFIVNRSQEGILFDAEELHALILVFDHYYPNQKFGYISNRLNSYTVNPIVQEISSLHENMAVQAVVCYSAICMANANFEESFYKKPFKIFEDLDTAKYWMNNFIVQRKKAGL